MQEETTKTKNKKYTCIECQNENTIEKDAKEGDIIECEFCGIEYELKKDPDNKDEFILVLLEEEK